MGGIYLGSLVARLILCSLILVKTRQCETGGTKLSDVRILNEEDMRNEDEDMIM